MKVYSIQVVVVVIMIEILILIATAIVIAFNPLAEMDPIWLLCQFGQFPRVKSVNCAQIDLAKIEYTPTKPTGFGTQRGVQNLKIHALQKSPNTKLTPDLDQNV